MIESISFWEKQSLARLYDYVIVGAGFVGISAAIHLKKKDPDCTVAVLERGVISYGASTRNAGFACFGSVGELEDDLSSIDLGTVLDTVKMRYEGLQKMKSMVPSKVMQYQELGASELFTDKSTYLLAKEKIDFWNKELSVVVGETVFVERDIAHSGFYPKAIFNQYEGQLNPKESVEFLIDSARTLGVRFFFGMEVQEWKKEQDFMSINTKQGLKFSAKKILLATNAFSKQLVAGIDLIPARNQVLITEEIDNNPWKGCFHSERGYIYFRNVGKRILLGGARNISNKEDTADYGNTSEIQDFLKDYLENRLMDGKKIKIDHWWSGILGVGAEKKPIIRKYADRIYLAVRLGGMGVAIGLKVGEQLATLVKEDEI